jgi:hypothetical protein
MKLRTITITMALFCSVAAYALISDFNGSYQKIPTIRDPWCGTSIEIKKIRFNKYRISWELITGERSVVELVGRTKGDMIDFRNKEYGYTYALAENKNRLIVTLTVPKKTIVCEFLRTKEK